MFFGSSGEIVEKEFVIAHPFEQGMKEEENSSQTTTTTPTDHFTLLDSVDKDMPNNEAERKKREQEDPEAAVRKRRGYILMELIETEEDYVKDMEMIVELFLVPLRITKVITKTEADNVFQNLPHLIPINRDLLERLKEQAKLKIEEQRVGKIFLSFLNESIKEYTQVKGKKKQFFFISLSKFGSLLSMLLIQF